MNEVDLIRTQLSVERQHAAEVSKACASALWAALSPGRESLAGLEPFRQASVEYLVWILARFEAREQVLRELVHSRFAANDPTRRAVDETLALAGSSREVLARFEAALGSGASTGSSAAAGAGAGPRAGAEPGTDPHWDDFLRFFSGAWSVRRDQLDILFERQAKVADWRVVSGIDADSIFEERNRYARVRATLPPGIEMPPAPARA
ncbi:MAG: hypothetical protein JWN85_3997 [Gammaproteobacteria bacterium]|jgi:hypothetical protein|nr:hypothetical protein [Gammaproteobacteria bacterium]